MTKLVTLSLSVAVALGLSGCSSTKAAATPAAAPKAPAAKHMTIADAVAANEVEVCSVAKNGIETVIATAEAYNNTAKKEGVEFRRLGINNTDAIIAVKEAIKTGAKEVEPLDFKGKPGKQKFDVVYAAERACKFGIGALKQKDEAEKTYIDAIPGGGVFQYK